MLCVFSLIFLMYALSFEFLIHLFTDEGLLKQIVAYLVVIIHSNISLTQTGLNHCVSVHITLRYIFSFVRLHVSVG